MLTARYSKWTFYKCLSTDNAQIFSTENKHQQSRCGMSIPGGGCGQENCVQSCIENVIRTATETGGSGDTGASCNTEHHNTPAPSYLSDDCQPVSHSRPRRLRSSDSLTCVVRCAHNTYGDRCFATAGPRVWNSLPIKLQQCDSLGRFKRCLKTFLFGSWNYGAL